MKRERNSILPDKFRIPKSGVKSLSGCNIRFPQYIWFVILLFLYTQSLSAQTYALQSGFNDKFKLAIESIPVMDTTEAENSFAADSMPPPPKPRLLPENISFGEKLFWGENGVFRKVGIVPELSSDERRKELDIRRFMLTTHQISGFTTVALMITAAYFGQRTIDNHMNRSLGDTHQQLVGATIATYSLTALLAVLSPPPMIRRDDEESTTTLHKTLAWIHAAGMIITPILGSMIGGRRSFNTDKAHFHQVAGYITTAVFTTSLIVVTF
ncbi:MAG: hypothetical protein P4L45_03890 [Ignavibacteriaceae bacterium]|nr:hypothetical protein [Ignavibacteriaceae bacterium]